MSTELRINPITGPAPFPVPAEPQYTLPMTDALYNKHVVVGITGGIAAYKIPDLVRRLRERGAEVRVVLTANATQFITPLTLQAVSGHTVHCDLLDPAAESGMGHIELARWADIVCVAPASANFLARLAHGFGDDLLTTLCLATTAQIVVAPAMNQQMWQNSRTQANLSILQQHSIAIIGPAIGDQACGDTGPGRLVDPADIVAQLADSLSARTLEGISVLITAGPTWEAIDPVRGLTNHSSGKMGYATAAAAANAGAKVTLISGPTALAPPAEVTLVPVTAAREMHGAVQDRIDHCDIFIAVAAVADYRPVRKAKQKIKKDESRMTLELTRNPDILASVTARRNAPFTVGFAAETSDLKAHATNKLRRKRIDLIAANAVGDGIAFGSDTNALTLIDNNGAIEIGPAPKLELARTLIAEIAERYHAKASAQDS